MIKLQRPEDEQNFELGERWYSLDDGKTWLRGSPPYARDLRTKLGKAFVAPHGIIRVYKVDHVNGIVFAK